MQIRYLVAASLSAALLIGGSASAAALNVIHDFCAESGCTDGSAPGGLTRDAAGTFYGATAVGGTHNAGTVFALTPNADRTAWTSTVLYNFCAKANCRDGSNPKGALVLDGEGNLYGVTDIDANDPGTVFKLSPNAHRTRWRLTTLYRFCALHGCADGKQIDAGLTYAGAASGAPYDGVSPLFGTTNLGGANDRGVVFALTPSGGSATEQVLHHFCSAANCADGSVPDTSLTVDASGNILGTTGFGGANGVGGTIFKLTPGSGGSWSESVLHSFCGVTKCADGGAPSSAVLIDAAGDMFGTTGNGGANKTGVAFRLAADGSYAVLKNFCDADKCADGAYPAGDLTMDGSGTLYGTTRAGGHGRRKGGVVYAVGGSGYTVLHAFCVDARCSDGYNPDSGVILDATGTLFGAALQGGAHGSGGAGGTVFEIAP